MVKIRRQLIKDTSMKFAGTNPKTYLTIHETGNRSQGANAAAHANLQTRQWEGASWHWTVDDKEAVQSYSHDFRLWHAGDGQGHGNMSSIAIETCIHAGNDWAKTKRNLIDLAVKVMQDEGIPLSRVVQHNHWSGKNCPTDLRSNSNREWNEIIAGIKAKLEGEKAPSKPKPAKPTVTLKTRWWNYKTAADAKALKNSQKLMPAGTYEITKTSQGQPHLRNVNGKHSGWVHSSVLGGPEPKAPARKSNAQIAREIVSGVNGVNPWGNEPQRSQKLRAAGYDPAAVQREVNKLV